jgi:hypothetical protein
MLRELEAAAVAYLAVLGKIEFLSWLMLIDSKVTPLAG